jgi:hypothetical protein
MKYKRSINVNGILTFFNFIVFGLICYGLIFDLEIEKNPYIDRFSLALGLLLTIQTWVLLYIEKSRPDPFILVLAYVTLAFYSLRIFTISLYPYSVVFDRIGVYSTSDSNFSLCIIFLSNAFLAAGLFSHQLKSVIKINNVRPMQPMLPFLVLTLLIILSLFNLKPEDVEIARYLGFLFLFLSPMNFFLICAVYLLTYREHIKLAYKITLIFISFILIIIQTLGGSRSGILAYLNYLFFLIIVLMPYFSIKLRSFAIAIAAMPAILLLMGFLFVIVTMSRPSIHGQNLDVSQQTEVAKNNIQAYEYSSELDNMSGLIFARAGYFDFTSEIIAHRKEYSDIFTLQSYFMSVIDNVLTPGFDFFDFPKIGNGLSQIYYGAEKLSKKTVNESYQSDQISLIAELFTLFGYLSFFILFSIGRLFKKLYSSNNNIFRFGCNLKRIFLVIIFYSLLLSFGFDWWLLELITLAVTMILLKQLFRLRFMNVDSSSKRYIPNI